MKTPKQPKQPDRTIEPESPQLGTASAPVSRSLHFQVVVDDNSHYQDTDHRYKSSAFDSLDGAITKCKQIVDAYLIEAYRPGATAGGLYQSYTMFGEDPWISGDTTNSFSAWSYAKLRCEEMCRPESQA